MSVPTGTASLLDIQNEFGGSAPISLSEYYGAAAGVPSSGVISIDDLRGKTNIFTFNITSNQTNANLRTLAVNAGWDGTAPVEATINSGVIISGSVAGNSTGALTVNGSWPGGVTLTNKGVIVGRGGSGGSGGSGNGRYTANAGGGGGTGGRGLVVSSALTLNNMGTIAGGGGGGGGGGAGNSFSSSSDILYSAGGPGGGGGRSGLTNASGGGGGYQSGYGGNTGTYNARGNGGGKRNAGGGNVATSSGTGGTGGNWGSSGNSGNSGTAGAGGISSNGGGGGAAGQAINGNGNITYIATGTRLGAIA